MSEYQYPRLAWGEIITALDDKQIASITETDLRHLRGEFVCDLYTRLLIYVDALQEEEKGQIDFTALEQFENPEHHVGSVQVMNLHIKVKHLLSWVDCPAKFTLKDLLRPDAGRTEFFVSAILNFALHRDQNMEQLTPLADNLSLLDERQREYDAKISQLNAEIEEVNDVKEMELPFVHEVDAKVKELRQTIGNMNNEQMSLRASIRKLREKSEDMDKEVSAAESELTQAVQENANLRSKIVQSPEKLQRALEEKKSAREEAKNSERSALNMYQEKAAVLDVYAKALKKMVKHSAQMQAINEQISSAKSIEKDCKVLKTKLGDDGMLEKSLEAKLVERRWKVGQLQESVKHLKKERDLKIEEVTRELYDVKRGTDFKRQGLEERRSRVKSVYAEVDAIIERTEEVKKAGQMKMQQLASKSDEVMEWFQNYMNSMVTLMGDERSGPSSKQVALAI